MDLVCKCEVPEKSPGVIFCERHDCEKTRHMAQLCQAGQRGESPGVKYWQAWEEGRGPGHPNQSAQLVRQTPLGSGDCLHTVLTEKFGQKMTAGCNCGVWIQKMNKWGPAGCRKNIRDIVSHLMKEAAKRKIKRLTVPVEKLPGARLYLRRLVERAIRRSEKDNAKWAARPKIMLWTHGLNCGGAERWVVDLARHIDPEKLSVRVVVGQSCACAIDPALGAKVKQVVPVITDPAKGRKAIDGSDVTVFWNKQPVGNPGAWVFCAHGCGPWLKTFVDEILTKSDIRLTAVSQMVAEQLAMPSTATVVYNGSDPARLVPRAGRRATRQRLGVKPGEMLIGYIGRMAAAKRPGAAAEAAAYLNCRGVFARAVCALGTQGPEKGRLAPAGVPLPIMYPRTEELGDLFAALDCFVLASESEGFSLAMIEAWLCGVPVVATPVGAVPELEARYGKLVVRVPVGCDGSTLADAVAEAVVDHEMVDRARELAHREFTVEAMGRRWTEYLLGVIT